MVCAATVHLPVLISTYELIPSIIQPLVSDERNSIAYRSMRRTPQRTQNERLDSLSQQIHSKTQCSVAAGSVISLLLGDATSSLHIAVFHTRLPLHVSLHVLVDIILDAELTMYPSAASATERAVRSQRRRACSEALERASRADVLRYYVL